LHKLKLYSFYCSNELENEINKSRWEHGKHLPALACGTGSFPESLEYVAYLHTDDLDKSGQFSHSWFGYSERGWQCDFSADATCMWDKLRKLHGQSHLPDVYEISCGSGSTSDCMGEWHTSAPHYSVFLERGIFSGYNFKSVGCYSSGKNSNCWFAQQ